MKSDRLWPVLTGLALLLGGAAWLEHAATGREVGYHVIRVGPATEASGEADPGEAAWESEPTSPEQKQARDLLRRGDTDAALAAYAALSNRPDAAPALLAEFADAQRRAGKCDEAAPVLERAIAQAPHDGAVKLAVALNQVCRRDAGGARATFAEAVALRPNHSRTRLAYADLLESEGSADAAAGVLEPAARSGSNEERARALVALGRCQLRLGQVQQARASLEQAIARSPSSIAVWTGVAKAYLISTDPADHQTAVARARQAVQLAPDSAAAASALGRALEKTDDNAGALAAYVRAAQLDASGEWARARVVRLALDLEDNSAADRASRELLRIAPDHPEYHVLRGLVLTRTGATQEARAAYERAIALRQDVYPEAWYNLGLLERDAKQPKAAAAAYEKAIAQRPDYREAWNNLGLVHMDVNDLDQAIRAFREALRIDPTYAGAWNNLGRAFADQDDYASAADAWEHALTHNPGNRTVRLRLAAAYRRTGQVARAIDRYRTLVKDEPRYVSAWYNMGIALAADNRNDEAITAYQTALQIDPAHRASLENLGLLQARTGKPEQARKTLDAALDLDPTDAEVRLKLAELAFAAQDLSTCHRHAAAVLASQQRDPVATTLLAKCP